MITYYDKTLVIQTLALQPKSHECYHAKMLLRKRNHEKCHFFPKSWLISLFLRDKLASSFIIAFLSYVTFAKKQGSE